MTGVPPSDGKTERSPSGGWAHLAAGEVVAGDFEVVRLIGEGGFGAVYEVRQRSTRAARALKVMRPELVRDDKMRARFEQEARVGAGIGSDHVVGVIGSGVDDARGFPWLAMELLEGQPLNEAVPPQGFDAATSREILAQICHGLGAAHAAGVVHRDLKPENVFLAKARRAGVPFTVKILDFGIAKVFADAGSTQTAALGSPTWAAPEQMERAARVGPATDVWALGLLAFWILTGRSFWQSANMDPISVQAVLKEIVIEPIPPPVARVRQLGLPVVLPPRFGGWFLRCVDRDPGARYADANAAGEALAGAFAPSDGSLAALETGELGAAPLPAVMPGQVAVPFAGYRAAAAPVASPAKAGRRGVMIGVALLVGLSMVAFVVGAFSYASSSASSEPRTPDDRKDRDKERREKGQDDETDEDERDDEERDKDERAVKNGPPPLDASCAKCEDAGQGKASNALNLAIQAASRDTRGCLDQVPKDEPVSGMIALEMRVSATGAVCRVGVRENATGSPKLEACVVQLFESRTYPPPDQGCVTYGIPIAFAPL